MKVIFNCVKCNHTYESEPGPTKCPECNNIWIRWINYEEWFKSSSMYRRILDLNSKD